MSSVDLLIAKYVNAAIRHKEGYTSGNSKKANAAADALAEVAADLDCHGDLGKAALAQLMDHGSMAVRCSAARDCLFLPDHGNKARQTLSEIARQDEGLIGFDAEMVLKVWDKGDLHDPWPSTQATCKCGACRRPGEASGST